MEGGDVGGVEWEGARLGGHTASFLRLFSSCFLSDDDEINVNARPRRCKAAAAEDKRILLTGDGEFFFVPGRAAQECVGPSTRSG